MRLDFMHLEEKNISIGVHRLVSYMYLIMLSFIK